MPWTLSTSQQPQSQMNRGFDCNIPEARDTVSYVLSFRMLFSFFYYKIKIQLNLHDIIHQCTKRRGRWKTPSMDRHLSSTFYI